jgi:homoserine acetyltransferase
MPLSTAAGGGGVRWYEFRVAKDRTLQLYQQGTYAPGGFYRWMPSVAMDKNGSIGIGYSFGGPPNFVGQRFAGRVEPDGTPSVVSYLRHQGRKLLERFDEDTYRSLVRAMDTHDIGRDRGGEVAALQKLAAYGTRLTGVGIEGDILYGTNQVQAMVDTAKEAGLDAAYREICSTKGNNIHDTPEAL